MKAEKTITILGKEVRMLYCAATETGYEQLSGQTSAVFIPTDGNPPAAKAEDYIKLAFAGIIAAYTSRGDDEPISINDILYEATPDDISTLINTIVELRLQWYNVPAVMQKENKGEEPPKNV